jgi:hypothetical protein
MKVADFIFRSLHNRNCLTLSILTPFRSPCTPSVNCAHLFVNCENTSNDCTNFSDDCAHDYDDCVNTLVDTLDVSSLDLCIPNPALL